MMQQLDHLPRNSVHEDEFDIDDKPRAFKGGSKFLDFEYMSKQGIKFEDTSDQNLGFDLIVNKAGDRVLAIQNQSQEDDMIFINLTKLIDQPAQPKRISNGQLFDASEDEIKERLRKQSVNQEFVKLESLNKFPLIIEDEDIPSMTNLIAKGAHAAVYQGEYFGTPVAVKEYNSREGKSLNAFISELNAYSGLQHRVMSHQHIVGVVGAYSKD